MVCSLTEVYFALLVFKNIFILYDRPNGFAHASTVRELFNFFLKIMFSVIYQLFKIVTSDAKFTNKSSFDLICQIGWQKGSEIFAIQLYSFGEFNHTLNHPQGLLGST